jgi:hypothetical protein
LWESNLRGNLARQPGEAAMDWMQILLAIILIGIAIELAYVVKAIGSTNRLLASLLKHIK